MDQRKATTSCLVSALVWCHSRRASLAWPEDLWAVAVQLPLPLGEGGGVDAHHPAGSAHVADSAATANTVDEGVQQVTLRHGDASLLQPPQRDAQGVPENCATPW
jgi:hypothetical protein